MAVQWPSSLLQHRDFLKTKRAQKQRSQTYTGLLDNRAWTLSERTARDQGFSSFWTSPIHSPPTPCSGSWAVTHSPRNRAQFLQQLCPEGHQIQTLAAGWASDQPVSTLRSLSMPKRGMPGLHFWAPELDHGFQRLTHKNTHLTEGSSYYPTSPLFPFLLCWKKENPALSCAGLEAPLFLSFPEATLTEGSCQQCKEVQVETVKWEVPPNFFPPGV